MAFATAGIASSSSAAADAVIAAIAMIMAISAARMRVDSMVAAPGGGDASERL